MYNTKPFISVIVTCYNEAQFISETLKSVLNQTRIDLVREIIVVDDGSKDDSGAIISELAQNHPIIKYIYQDNAGLPSARNTAIRHCSGDYVAICDGDDLWEPQKLEVQLGVINLHPYVGLIYSNFYTYIYQEDKLIPVKVNRYQHDTPNLLAEFLASGGPIVPSTVMIKRQCFEEVGEFDPEFRVAQDTEMWLRVATKFSFQHVPDFLVRKREVQGSLGANTIRKAAYYKKAFDKIERIVPNLGPYRRKREAIISYKVGWYYYQQLNFIASAKASMEGIRRRPLYLKNYVLLLSSILRRATGFDLMRFIG